MKGFEGTRIQGVKQKNLNIERPFGPGAGSKLRGRKEALPGKVEPTARKQTNLRIGEMQVRRGEGCAP